MHAPDPANQFDDITTYGYCANNPVSRIDPDGAVVHWLVGAAIGGVINLAGQAIKGNIHSFKQGLGAFGMGAIAGAIAAGTGGASLTTGQFVAQSAVGQLPGANVSLGGGFNLSLSPALMMGTQGMSLGANIGLGYSSGNYSFGVSSSLAYGNSNITGRNGWSSSIGGGASFNDGSTYISLSTMKYNSGETSQRTGTFGVGGKNWKFHYENDFQPVLTKYLGISDNGDKFRTAAGNLSVGDLSIGFNLFTGDPGPTMETRPSSEINGKRTYDGGGKYSPDKYRLGAAYFGYKNMRVGGNSEAIRHVIQNRFAHDFMTSGRAKWFRVLNKNPATLYGNVGNQNPYSLW
jgi:hypothetical protein